MFTKVMHALDFLQSFAMVSLFWCRYKYFCRTHLVP